MKVPLTIALLALFLTGCSATVHSASESEESPSGATPVEIPSASPEAESEYLGFTFDTLPSDSLTDENRDAILSYGYNLCEDAAEERATTAEIAQADIETLDASAPDHLYQVALRQLQGKYAGELLCPEYSK